MPSIVDATVFTEAGYSEDGEHPDRLLQVCDYNVAQAEKGIIYIDEIKRSPKSDNPSITRDVSGEGSNRSLLKMLEGTTVNVPPYGGRKHPEQKMITVNTQNILFICGGAFEDREHYAPLDQHPCDRLQERRLRTDRTRTIAALCQSPDMKSFGLIPELIGRMPVLTWLEPLDKSALKRIWSNRRMQWPVPAPDGLEDVRLSFDDEALDYIAELAINSQTGEPVDCGPSWKR